MALNCVSLNESRAERSQAEYIKEVFKYPSLSAEDELKTAKEAKEGSIEAKQKLIKANLKLVVITAKKMVHTGNLPLIDLIQEGNIGLMAAADKFNWEFGYRFATYAVWWIKQAMFKAVSEQSHSVKIPVYIQETLSKYAKIKADLEKDGNTDADIKDIAQKMNVDEGKINNYLNANKTALSLEGSYEMYNGSEVRLSDIIEDKKSSVSGDIEREHLKSEIVKLLNGLKDREQKVITLRFGLNGEEKQTLEEIGKMYSVTKECIRQTEARALGRLRNNPQALTLYSDYLK